MILFRYYVAYTVLGEIDYDQTANGGGMSRSLLNFAGRRCWVERYAAFDAGATG